PPHPRPPPLPPTPPTPHPLPTTHPPPTPPPPLSLHDALPICPPAGASVAPAPGPGPPNTLRRLPSDTVPASGVNRKQRSRRKPQDRKSTRLNSSHLVISYAVFCLKKKKRGLASWWARGRVVRG